MEGENRKHLLDVFQQHVYEGYLSYCEEHELSVTAQGMITYLIDRDLLAPQIIRRFTLLREFQELAQRRPEGKTRLVQRLADRFGLSERAVWNFLRGTTAAAGVRSEE